MKRWQTMVALLLCTLYSITVSATELRLITHSAFALPKRLLANFERQSGAKLTIIRAGDAGEMVNKLILTKLHPIADVVYGVDNTLITRAVEAGILDDKDTHYVSPLTHQPKLHGGVSIDYGYITLNYDKAWFAHTKLPLPKTLEDLTHPAYKGLLVVENPATSSTGLGFLLATIKALGEEQAFNFWGKLRANGVKVVIGWKEAYYTEFSHNGGTRPIVVSYATSPAAELFYSTANLNEAPTANLLLPGAVFRQVEGAALVKGGRSRRLAAQFISFLLSEEVQKELQTSMWMYPVLENVPLAPAFSAAPRPAQHDTLDEKRIYVHSQAWIRRWVRTVLR